MTIIDEGSLHARPVDAVPDEAGAGSAWRAAWCSLFHRKQVWTPTLTAFRVRCSCCGRTWNSDD